MAAKAALRVFDSPKQGTGRVGVSVADGSSRVFNFDDTDDEDKNADSDIDDVGDVNEEYVQEILKDIQASYLPSVTNCRTFVRKVRATQQNELDLRGLCVSNNIQYKALKKDMPVRWNSTHDMIR